jgi:transcriptional regulator GlxA family with amidase domain
LLGEWASLSPATWLRELGLYQARQLLEAGGFGTVAAVAEAVGFASAQHFSNLYAERFGRRPSDYHPPKNQRCGRNAGPRRGPAGSG